MSQQPPSFYQAEDSASRHAGGRVLPSGTKARAPKTRAPQTIQTPRTPQLPSQIYQTPPRPIPQMSLKHEAPRGLEDDAISMESYRQQGETNGEKANSISSLHPGGVHVTVEPLESTGDLRNGPRRGVTIRAAQRTPQAGYLNLFRVKGGSTIPYKTGIHWFRDAMGRKSKGREEDCYVSEKNGRLRRLVVQAADESYHSNQSQTWKQTFIRNTGPWMLRLAYWPINAEADWLSFPVLGWVGLVIKWILSCAGLFFVMLRFPSNSALRPGMYNPFPYRLREYPKSSRNIKEDDDPNRVVSEGSMNAEIKHERLLRPHTLCYLKDPESQEKRGIHDLLDEDGLNTERPIRDMSSPYLFVSFTSEHFRINSQSDINDLHEIAEMATRRAKLPAYWLSCTCMSDDAAQFEQDVYRINDVIRGASSVVIAIGHPEFSDGTADENTLLKAWGRRVWTLPEALLCTHKQDLEVYMRGTDLRKPRTLSKTEIARVAWDDSEISRQLINHYDGSLTLSRLELVILAIKCLRTRDKGKNHLPGDLPYALMGLLRRRPRVDSSDSEFQALARLSLANDSDRLLERMICALPKWGGDWLTADDSWEANLWDIYPKCQVSAIGYDDTVVLDGCYAAAIRWKSFAYVTTAVRISWKRYLMRFILRISPWLTIIFGVLASIPAGSGGLKSLRRRADSNISFYGNYPSTGAFTFIIILLTFLICTVLMSPLLIRVLYGGKLWDQQPWLFGFEGYMDIKTIESQIFGYNLNRLSWSPAGSPLSRHRPNRYGECVGVDPTVYDEDVKNIVETAKTRAFGEPRVFTIVDTYTMTVTIFEAVRPPVMVLLCGSEGGMQRAVMCSYDWKSQTLSRESVLRMETPVVEKMWRIGRVKFGFNRSTAGTQEV